MLSYDHLGENIDVIVDRFRSEITAPCVLVGHSLGGILALALHDHPQVQGIVTIASPLGGLKLNLLQKIMSLSRMISEIATDSACMHNLHHKQYDKPVLHLVSTQGFNPFMYEPNDGVIPLSSQTRWTCGETTNIATNHYEIVQHDQTVTAITQFCQRFSNF
jgi:pimeloyl-ACP methyl ester carboxylesterase